MTTNKEEVSPPRRKVSLAVQPSIVNTLRTPLVVQGCWRLGSGAFRFDAKFISRSTRQAFERFKVVRERLPSSPIALFGHTDPSGGEEYNHRLSADRVMAVYGVLRQDPDMWYELYAEDATGLTSMQDCLRRDGHDIDPEERAFGPTTREAVRAHFEYLMGGVRLKVEDFLGSGTQCMQACSEFNPVLRLGSDHVRQLNAHQRREIDSVNRRVVAYFFDPETHVEDAWPCPVPTEGPEACRARFWSDHERRNAWTPTSRQYWPWPRQGRGQPHAPIEPAENVFRCRFYDRIAALAECERVIVELPPEKTEPPELPDRFWPKWPEPPPAKPPKAPPPLPDQFWPQWPEPPVVEAPLDVRVTCSHPRRANSAALVSDRVSLPEPYPDRIEVVPPPDGDALFLDIGPTEERARARVQWNGQPLLKGMMADPILSVRVPQMTSWFDHPFILYSKFKVFPPTDLIEVIHPMGSRQIEVRQFPDKPWEYDAEAFLDKMREEIDPVVWAINKIGKLLAEDDEDFEFKILEDEDTFFRVQTRWREAPDHDSEKQDFRAYYWHSLTFRANPLMRLHLATSFTMLALLKRLRRIPHVGELIDRILDYLPPVVRGALDVVEVKIHAEVGGGGEFHDERRGPDAPLVDLGLQEGQDRAEISGKVEITGVGALETELDLSSIIGFEGFWDYVIPDSWTTVPILLKIELRSATDLTLGLIMSMSDEEFGFYVAGATSGLKLIITENILARRPEPHEFVLIDPQRLDPVPVILVDGHE